MSQQCSSCSTVPGMVTGLLHVYENGDPIHMIVLLTDFLSTDETLCPKDKLEISEVINLLAAVAKQRESDSIETLHKFKIPA